MGIITPKIRQIAKSGAYSRICANLRYLHVRNKA